MTSTFSPFSSGAGRRLGWRLGAVLGLKSSPVDFADTNARIAFLIPSARPPPKIVKKVGAIVVVRMRRIHRISAPATVIDAAPLS